MPLPQPENYFDRLMFIAMKACSCHETSGIRYFMFAIVIWTLYELSFAINIINAENVYDVMDVIVYVICSAGGIVTVILLYHRKLMNATLNRGRENLFRYTEDEQMQRDYEQTIDRTGIKSVFSVVSILLYASVFFFVIPPQIIAIYSADKTRSSFEKSVAFPTWFPFKLNTWRRFLIANAMQSSAAAVVSFNLQCGFLLFFYETIIVRYETEALFEIMNRTNTRLDNERKANYDRIIRESNNGRGVRNNDNSNNINKQLLLLQQKDEASFITFLKQCYQHHVAICKFVTDTVECYMVAIVILMGAMYMDLVLDTYLIIKEPHFSRKLERVVNFAITMTVLFVLCYIGERLIEINGRYRDQIYQTTWYDRPIAVKKLVLRLLCVNNWTQSISFTPNKTLSLMLFGAIIKSVYSTIQFLIAVT
uniref:Odorant receptor n=1 Tax=Drosicha corpulenta TaxID=535978 RepID=A0A0U3TV29_9HEMI|nr:odorant receptor 18 [Drosicha corpulenta]